jgi:hypothetical protein
MKAFLGSVSVMLSLMAGHCSMLAHQRDVAGTWTMAVDTMSLRLELTQDGTAVGGTLMTPHGLLRINGEFVDPRLTFGGSIEGAPHSLHMSATGSAQADGSLAGTLTSDFGDMGWTAVRSGQ